MLRVKIIIINDMGEAISNLVIIKGKNSDVRKFRSDAFYDESRAFHFEKLLPMPTKFASEYIDDFYELAYNWTMENWGNKWGSGFSVIFMEKDNEVHYFFNSKNQHANIGNIAKKYPEIEFTHFYYDHGKFNFVIYFCKIYIEGHHNAFKFNDYELGIYSPYIEGMMESQLSLDAETMWGTPAQIEETYWKFTLLMKNNKKDFEKALSASCNQLYDEPLLDYSAKLSFYDFNPRQQFLKNNQLFYDNLLKLEEELNKKKLEFARDIAYSIEFNSIYEKTKLKFDSIDSKAKQLIEVNKFLKLIEQNNYNFNIGEDLEQIVVYFSSVGFNKEVACFAEKYIDNKIKKIDEFNKNKKGYINKLKDYEGITVGLDVFEDSFINNNFLYLREDNEKYVIKIDKNKIDIYERKRETLRHDYEVMYDEGNKYENIFLKVVKESKETHDTTILEKYISERAKLEKRAEVNFEICKKKFNDSPFSVIYSVDVDFNYKILDDLGILLESDGRISYDTHFFKKNDPLFREIDDDLPF